jgi:hypothetical protein
MTICRNRISVSNDRNNNNNNNNVGNKIILILPNPPPPPPTQYLHIKTLYLFCCFTVLKMFPITVIIHKTVSLHTYIHFTT